MAGYRLWSDGERPTGADITNYLVSQSVMQFASAEARSAQVELPEAGMMSYLRDVDEYQTFDGAVWRTMWTLDDTYLGPWSTTLAAADTITAGTANVVVEQLVYPKESQRYFTSLHADIDTATSGNFALAALRLKLNDALFPEGAVHWEVDQHNRMVIQAEYIWTWDTTEVSGITVGMHITNHDSSENLRIFTHSTVETWAIDVDPTEAA